MKKGFCIVLLIAKCMALPIVASQISFFSDTQVIKTQHFDFIFETQSIKTAQSLASVAEEYYKEITDKLEVPTMNLHLPVVITNESDQLNGYFTNYPYNRIVLYDTVAFEGSLSVFSDPIRSVFYHELTHAISLNIKSSFWNAVANVFGDFIAPSSINCPTSISEGASVSFESTDGEGRMNDVFSKHILQQAKIEDCFPSLLDVTGARDTYPSGNLPYIFGGAFAKYLQVTYGDEKYADFWRENGKLHFFYQVYDLSLKKIYGKSASVLWHEFYDSIEIPEDIIEPETAFVANKPNSFINNAKKYFYPQNLCSAQIDTNKSLLVWQDGNNGNVYGAIDDISNSLFNAQKLFSSILTEHISLDKNAEYLSISGYTNDEKPQNITRIYALSSFSESAQKNKISVKYTGISIPELRDASILDSNYLQSTDTSSFVYVAGVQTESQNSSLVVYQINVSEKTTKEINRIEFGPNQIPFTPMQISKNKILFLLKDSLDWKLAIADSDNKITTFDTDLNIRGISVSDDTVLCSCASKKEGYPVYASTSVKDLLKACTETGIQGWSGDSATGPLWTGETKKATPAILSLYEQSYSGGVYEPVLCGDSTIFYVSHFYDSWQLSVMDANTQKTTKTNKLFAIDYNIKNNDNFTQTASSVITFTPEKYHSTSYFNKGVFVPFAGIGLSSLTSSDSVFSNDFLPSLGVSWITMDPTERFLVLAGLGFDFTTFSCTTNLSAQTQNSYNNWSFDAAFNFNIIEITKAFAKVNFDHAKYIGFSNWYTIASDTVSWYYGKTVFSLFLNALFNTPTFINRAANDSQLGIGWQKTTGVSSYQYLKFSSSIIAAESYSIDTTDFNYAAGIYFTAHLPQLLPFNTAKDITLNWPTSFSCIYYLPLDDILDPDSESFEWQSTVILFSKEIQKGIPIINIYDRRIILDVGCDGSMYENGLLDIVLHTSVYTDITFNSGYLVSYHFNLGAQLYFYPCESEENCFKISMKTTM